MTKRILICGDSFAADWSIKYLDYPGWPNLIANEYIVTNLAQAGVSEYKIWLQLKSANLSQYDIIILSHTSPYRIPIEEHPAHKDDLLHKNCDLIYLDAKKSDNKELQPIVDYFEKYFIPDYACFVHNLIIDQEINYLQEKFAKPVINITNLDWSGLRCTNNFISFHSVFKQHPGLINHFSKHGNQLIFEKLKETIDAIC